MKLSLSRGVLYFVDHRKDVLEQKVKKALEEIGFSKKIVYKVGSIFTCDLTAEFIECHMNI